MFDFLWKAAIFLAALTLIAFLTGRLDSSGDPVAEVSAMSVQSEAPTPTSKSTGTAVRDNQRVIIQVNDFVIVGAICADGSSAKLDADHPPTAIYSCE